MFSRVSVSMLVHICVVLCFDLYKRLRNCESWALTIVVCANLFEDWEV